MHRKNCNNIKNVTEKHNERLIDVNWGNKANDIFKADISILSYERPDLLRDITNIFSTEKANLTALNSSSGKKGFEIKLTVEITDLSQLSRLLEKISQLKGIISADRTG